MTAKRSPAVALAKAGIVILLLTSCNALMTDVERGGPRPDGGDTDTDTDADTDTDTDTDLAPVITGIDGDGSLRDVNGDTSGVTDPSPANHRFRYAWTVTGERLDTVTDCELQQTSGGTAVFTAADGLEFMAGGTSTERTLTLPTGLVAGAFTLTLTNPYGDTEAQTYILQGEGLDCDGTNCALPAGNNLVVGGQVIANEPDCPCGYARNGSVTNYILCEKTLAGGTDRMVKVGGFWIDKYETSAFPNADCTGTQFGASADNWAMHDNGNWGVIQKSYACSITGVTPSRDMTWFQAQQSCELSGKSMCTNAQWQAAAAGTHDPGSAEMGNQCRIAATNTSPRAAGLAGASPGGVDSCMSMWGVEDMIGNLWEWTSDWWGQGTDFTSQDQDAMFGGDGAWNVDPAEFQGSYTNYFSAATLRSGPYNHGSWAGVFTLNLHHGPSYSGSNIGARCCLR